jgi:hypothetical protein
MCLDERGELTFSSRLEQAFYKYSRLAFAGLFSDNDHAYGGVRIASGDPESSSSFLLVVLDRRAWLCARDDTPTHRPTELAYCV